MIEIRHKDTNVALACVEADTLQGADLAGAELRSATLLGADLRGASLQGARLVGAIVYQADLRGANLCGADLRGDTESSELGDALDGAVRFFGANLKGARYDTGTRWPALFDPRNRGCILARELSPAASPEGRGDEASPADAE